MSTGKTSAMAITAAIVLTLSYAASAHASLAYKGEFGTNGAGNGQFQLPDALAIGSGDDLYVTDITRNDVQRFTSAGQYKSKFGATGAGNGQFLSPFGIGIDYLGFVYVADTGNNRIQQFTSSGAYLRQWGSGGAGNGQFSNPSGVAPLRMVDNSVHPTVTDQLNFRAQLFSTLGVYEVQFPTGGGQMLDITTSPDQSMYLTDATNHRVARYAFGNLINTFGAQGSGDGQFEIPQGIDLDTEGNVWVVDSDNDNLQKFSEQGQFLARYGGSGAGPGQFDSPRDVAVADDGTIYVVDGINTRVQMFTEVAEPPAAEPQPGTQPQADQTAPDLVLHAHKAQRARSRKLTLAATCKNEACAATITGMLSVRRKRSARSARTIKLRSQVSTLASGERTRVNVSLGRKTDRRIRKALRQRKRVVATVTVTATDSAGNQTTKRKKIRLKR